MANPQLEDGYTSIANEILERLALIKISPADWRVLVTIIRRTYGFHKKVDWIANFQIVKSTGLCKAVVSRSLARLKKNNLIIRNGKTIGFQKNWEQWGKLAEQSTKVSNTVNKNKSLQNSQQKLAKQSTELTKSSTKVSSCAVTQKIKDNIQKIKDKEFLSEKSISLNELKNEANKLPNRNGKIAFLIDAFKIYHSDAPPDDLENLGGRIAGILKSISYDYGYLLGLIWDSGSIDISGSHLNYIQGMVKGGKKLDVATEYADSGYYGKLGGKSE